MREGVHFSLGAKQWKNEVTCDMEMAIWWLFREYSAAGERFLNNLANFRNLTPKLKYTPREEFSYLFY